MVDGGLQAQLATPMPDWFTRAIAEPYEEHETQVEGANIYYRAWGPQDAPPVVLIHGGGAIAGWWDHVAPYLATERRVLALDLSGHGDSEWREDYSFEQWGREALAVSRDQSQQRPTIIGHSMGGFISLVMAHHQGPEIEGAVAIDSPIGPHPTGQRLAALGRRSRSDAMAYPDRETILSRFHTMPDDPATLDFIRDYLAVRSIRQTERGWQWKFDIRVSSLSQILLEQIHPLRCRFAFIRGARGLATDERMKLLTDRIGPSFGVSVVPDAGHHIMLDQPIALTATLDLLLELWSNP